MLVTAHPDDHLMQALRLDQYLDYFGRKQKLNICTDLTLAYQPLRAELQEI
jgi:hypothetical protein